VWKSARLSLKQEELERYQSRQPISNTNKEQTPEMIWNL
jgi:hypothetical protein